MQNTNILRRTAIAAGLLLAFGDKFHLPLMMNAGGVIFDNLPMLFAIGSAVGLASESGIAALSAAVSVFVTNITISTVLSITPEMASQGGKYAMVVGIPTLQMGVFGGLICGILAAWCYNRFHTMQLPEFLGFFSGKRFVAIATAFLSFLMGLLLPYVWQHIQAGIDALSVVVNGDNQAASTFIFGLVERALIPLGLHHISYAVFRINRRLFSTRAFSAHLSPLCAAIQSCSLVILSIIFRQHHRLHQPQQGFVKVVQSFLIDSIDTGNAACNSINNCFRRDGRILHILPLGQLGKHLFGGFLADCLGCDQIAACFFLDFLNHRHKGVLNRGLVCLISGNFHGISGSGCLYCFGSLVLSQQQRANGSKHLVLCGISSCKGIIHILCNHISNHGKAGIFQQTVDYIIVDLSGIKILCSFNR